MSATQFMLGTKGINMFVSLIRPRTSTQHVLVTSSIKLFSEYKLTSTSPLAASICTLPSTEMVVEVLWQVTTTVYSKKVEFF